MIEIKNYLTGAVIYRSEAPTVAAAVIELCAAEPHQRWIRGEVGGVRADLRGADLAYMVMRDADLRGVDLRGADLTGAVLAGADLRHADLRAAVLAGTVLTGANLAAVIGLPKAPVVADLDKRMLESVEGGMTLSMSTWHSECGTTHCRAGWAVTLAGEPGRALEDELGSAVAGSLIYFASTGRVPDFYASDKAALADIRACAAKVAP